MINGIPVNDMENGWVFGQTGMELPMQLLQFSCKRFKCSELATPSIGGSMNVITDAAAQEGEVHSNKKLEPGVS